MVKPDPRLAGCTSYCRSCPPEPWRRSSYCGMPCPAGWLAFPSAIHRCRRTSRRRRREVLEGLLSDDGLALRQARGEADACQQREGGQPSDDGLWFHVDVVFLRFSSKGVNSQSSIVFSFRGSATALVAADVSLLHLPGFCARMERTDVRCRARCRSRAFTGAVRA